jgi:hypothetical protein
MASPVNQFLAADPVTHLRYAVMQAHASAPSKG